MAWDSAIVSLARGAGVGVTEAHVNPYLDFSQRSEVTPRAVSSAHILTQRSLGRRGNLLGSKQKKLKLWVRAP
jgi:hypothetical protein